nr:hypothetical protein [uncultured Mediterranean phage uvMED]
MRRAAFYLLAAVITFQLIMVAGVLTACFSTKTKQCTGDRMSELVTYIVTQAFAVYAAEKQNDLPR